MGLGRELDPGDVVAIISLLSEHDKREEVVVVKKPASTEKIQHIKHQVVGGDGGQRILLGNTRSSLAPSVVAYGGTRRGEY